MHDPLGVCGLKLDSGKGTVYSRIKALSNLGTPIKGPEHVRTDNAAGAQKLKPLSQNFRFRH